MNIRFLGHSCFELSDGSARVLIDPFLSGNPKAAAGPGDLDPDAILLTHGHGDHLGDTVEIARRTGAPVLAIVELGEEILRDLGEDHDVRAPNLGGTVGFDWGWARLVPAWHTGLSPQGMPHTPAGLVINFAGRTIYHLGDTALFSDLALPGRRDPIDLAIIPIGGHFTMDRHDAVTAAGLVGAPTVIPCHFDTFPPIETDAAAFASEIEAAGKRAVVLQPGEGVEL